MVDTESLTSSNGTAAVVLPEIIHMTMEESRQFLSPGAQRALKAETGRSFDDMVNDSADRIQTLIWAKLRREYPGVRWDDCADVVVQIVEGPPVDPTVPVASASSPPSAGSGG